MTQSNRYPRRRVLSLLASGVVGAATIGAAQQTENGGDEPAETFRLGGRVSGWIGQEPEEIQGTENPTLPVQEGEVYELTWENLDGAPHNFAFRDDAGNDLPVILPEEATVAETPTAGNRTGTPTEPVENGTATPVDDGADDGTDEVQFRIIPGESPLEDPEIGGPGVNRTGGNATRNETEIQVDDEMTAGNETGAAGNETTAEGVTIPESAISVTDVISEEGATQTFRFVATPEMTTYICPIHPETMVGDVQVETEREETETPSGI